MQAAAHCQRPRDLRMLYMKCIKPPMVFTHTYNYIYIYILFHYYAKVTIHSWRVWVPPPNVSILKSGPTGCIIIGLSLQSMAEHAMRYVCVRACVCACVCVCVCTSCYLPSLLNLQVTTCAIYIYIRLIYICGNTILMYVYVMYSFTLQLVYVCVCVCVLQYWLPCLTGLLCFRRWSGHHSWTDWGPLSKCRRRG